MGTGSVVNSGAAGDDVRSSAYIKVEGTSRVLLESILTRIMLSLCGARACGWMNEL